MNRACSIRGVYAIAKWLTTLPLTARFLLSLLGFECGFSYVRQFLVKWVYAVVYPGLSANLQHYQLARHG